MFLLVGAAELTEHGAAASTRVAIVIVRYRLLLRLTGVVVIETLFIGGVVVGDVILAAGRRVVHAHAVRHAAAVAPKLE